jgi:hypothetical protein
VSKEASYSPSVSKLARDAGMFDSGDAVAFLIKYCRRKVDQWVEQFEPANLPQLLDTVTARLGLILEYVETSEGLAEIVQRYVLRGEGGFIRVQLELDADTYALVVRLRQPINGRMHVAVIDCRGVKAARRWFSVWHEIAHLLVQPQLIFDFRRTRNEEKDAVESAMDAIAGELAFYEKLFSFESNDLTFESLESHRQRHSADASAQAAYATVIKRVKRPALLLVAEPALKVGVRRAMKSALLFTEAAPTPSLRAVTIIGSPSSAEAGLYIPKNMRVPQRSIIHRVHQGELAAETITVQEDLAWWTSAGKCLQSVRVSVEAKTFGSRIMAIIQKV